MYMDSRKLPHPQAYLTDAEAQVFAPLYGNPIRPSQLPLEPKRTSLESPSAPQPLPDWGSEDDASIFEPDTQTPIPAVKRDHGTLLSTATQAPANTPRRRGRPAKMRSLLPLAEEYLRLKQTHGPNALTVSAYLDAVGRPCSERSFFTALKEAAKRIT